MIVEDDERPDRPLDMTETLVFIIINYMLDNDGYGYSTQISEYVVSNSESLDDVYLAISVVWS